jgi:hypothetical protein
MEDSVKLTDTQRRLLAAASHRDDRALERPSHLTGGAAGKVVAKLVTEGLIEEIQSRGSLPVWRRDGDNTHTLRITKRGLQASRAVGPSGSAFRRVVSHGASGREGFPYRGCGPAFFRLVCDFCHARPLYHCGTGSDGRGTMAERDLTAREDRFIGLCLAAVAIIIVFIFIATS